ncbi:MAG TPA: thioredoxin domain-containing protein [Syntrophales bacterium]|nr:thioredoxin domain-containing protein [Syntrophales bacterium]HPI56803.1 thioredoxin domain-containing protein [Syntrophales bacterium]HPN25759.1 thioredoxin domain-containing protein [Syntrophales bacterium]HQM28724.1 thioredoxin domain-containing protein [Syntrophales bacterium]
MRILNLHRRAINITLSLAAIVLVILYSVCGDSCTYLQGTLLGFDLRWAGVAFMAVVMVMSFLKKDLPLLFLLAAGIGAEAYLVGFQVYHGVYCPYCLLFGAILLILFIVNFRMQRVRQAALGILGGFLIFLIFFEGMAAPAYAGDTFVPSFGSGPVQVRLYTDYFCGPCSALEPQIAKSIEELVRQKTIRITFIDTPIHKETILYARYFLYVCGEEKDFRKIMSARHTLFDAARSGITDPQGLEAHLAKDGIRYKRIDVKPTFDVFNGYLKEEGIRSTPTLTVNKGGKRETYKGVPDIARALADLHTAQKR